MKTFGQLFHSFNDGLQGIWWAARTQQGLYLLDNRDKILIIDKDIILWQGEIQRWNFNKVFSCQLDDAYYNNWVSWFPKGCDQVEWIKFFEKEKEIIIF